MLGDLTIREYVIPPFQSVVERSKGAGLMPGKWWAVKATLIDTRNRTWGRERLDPILVAEIGAEGLGWDVKKLEAEMSKYPA